MTRYSRRAMSAYVVTCLMFGLGCKPSPQPAAPVTAAQSKGDPNENAASAARAKPGIIGILKQEVNTSRHVAQEEAPRPLAAAPEPTAENAPADDKRLAVEPALRTRAQAANAVNGLSALSAPMKEMARQPSIAGISAVGRGYGYGEGALGAGHAGPTQRVAGPLGKTKSRMAIAELEVAPPPATPAEFNTEAYAHHKDNDFFAVKDAPLSTFSIDVDTASYSNMRRFLNQGTRPPADAVRIEELVNYFRYDYAPPRDGKPFSVHAEVGSCPWATDHRLVHIGVQGKTLDDGKIPPRNLVFLVNVSGSMNEPTKLPLLKRGLRLLVENLRAEDKLAMVVYAGASGVALPPIAGSNHSRILEAIDHLEAGGSTNGGEGIELAYKLAQAQFDKHGINRVILATDGDFNVGVTSEGELVRLIEEKRKSGVFLTVLGFGSGNLQDTRMESLADKGNGNYAYIDTIAEAHKVLVREAGSTLVTIAKDVKLQVEFNPKKVASYRLIGYENRVLAAQDFNDDKKDAGEIGAGHSVTALYEIVPVGAPKSASDKAPAVDPLRYQAPAAATEVAASDELMTLKVRYKQPSADVSEKFEFAVRDAGATLDQLSPDFRFAAAVAGFGMLLRGSEHKGGATLAAIRELAQQALGNDKNGDRHEFVALLAHAGALGVK